jgi:hypothetical protein
MAGAPFHVAPDGTIIWTPAPEATAAPGSGSAAALGAFAATQPGTLASPLEVVAPPPPALDPSQVPGPPAPANTPGTVTNAAAAQGLGAYSGGRQTPATDAAAYAAELARLEAAAATFAPETAAAIAQEPVARPTVPQTGRLPLLQHNLIGNEDMIHGADRTDETFAEAQHDTTGTAPAHRPSEPITPPESVGDIRPSVANLGMEPPHDTYSENDPHEPQLPEAPEPAPAPEPPAPTLTGEGGAVGMPHENPLPPHPENWGIGNQQATPESTSGLPPGYQVGGTGTTTGAQLHQAETTPDTLPSLTDRLRSAAQAFTDWLVPPRPYGPAPPPPGYETPEGTIRRLYGDLQDRPAPDPLAEGRTQAEQNVIDQQREEAFRLSPTHRDEIPYHILNTPEDLRPDWEQLAPYLDQPFRPLTASPENVQPFYDPRWDPLHRTTEQTPSLAEDAPRIRLTNPDGTPRTNRFTDENGNVLSTYQEQLQWLHEQQQRSAAANADRPRPYNNENTGWNGTRRGNNDSPPPPGPYTPGPNGTGRQDTRPGTDAAPMPTPPPPPLPDPNAKGSPKPPNWQTQPNFLPPRLDTRHGQGISPESLDPNPAGIPSPGGYDPSRPFPDAVPINPYAETRSRHGLAGPQTGEYVMMDGPGGRPGTIVTSDGLAALKAQHAVRRLGQTLGSGWHSLMHALTPQQAGSGGGGVGGGQSGRTEHTQQKANTHQADDTTPGSVDPRLRYTNPELFSMPTSGEPRRSGLQPIPTHTTPDWQPQEGPDRLGNHTLEPLPTHLGGSTAPLIDAAQKPVYGPPIPPSMDPRRAHTPSLPGTTADRAAVWLNENVGVPLDQARIDAWRAANKAKAAAQRTAQQLRSRLKGK